MKNQKNKALLCLLILILEGCGYSTGKTSVPPIPATQPSPPSTGQTDRQVQPVSFATIQQNIFNPSCVVCHNGPSGLGGVSLANHADVIRSGILSPGNGEGSVLFQEINSGSMPKGRARLRQTDIDAIKAWINQGALNN